MKSIQFFLVGTLFFVALGVVGYFTIITEGGPLKKELHTMSIFFPNSEGLKTGSKVTVQGVPYGYVSRVRLVQLDLNGEPVQDESRIVNTKVEVVVVLQQPLRLYENYRIKIRNESLLSGRVIAIDPGDSSTTHLKEQEIKKRKIEGGTSDDPLVSLSELIAENRADIRKTISNIAEISSKINSGEGTIGKLINNDEIHMNVNTTLTDAQIVLRELREGLEDTREQAPVTSFIRAALTAF
ncbi:MAG: MCE family protein [Leptospiraceae bacterium]|nr:MCE family protein [Leptospiraceae bacterium]MCP5512136.1 MCE family protein [Leptospiraceae bacterium]